MNVLFGENDEDENILYRTAFESKGHSVISTRDGRQCLDTYKKELAKTGKERDPFDVVILDSRMPVLDGLAVSREIISLRGEQRLVLTTTNVRETLKKCTEELNQVVPIIGKPFDPRKLVDIIEDASIPKQIAEVNRMFTDKMSGRALTESQASDILAILKRILKYNSVE